MLPGEDVVEYETLTSHWFASLRPTTFAEAQLVALIADVAWRLERLRRIEHGHQLAVLERALAATEEFIQHGLAQRALTAISALFEILSQIAAPVEELADIAGIVMAMSTVLGIVNEVEGLPASAVDHLDAAIAAVSSSKEGRVMRSALMSVTTAAEAVKVALENAMPKKQELVTVVKEKMVAERLLIEDGEMKKLAKYQQLLENTLTRHLEHLKAIKDSIRGVGVLDHDQLRELQVRLRVVR